MLGTEVDVPTLDGKTLRLKIPSGTQSHRKFRLRGKGVPGFRGREAGDQLVEVIVMFPKPTLPTSRSLPRSWPRRVIDVLCRQMGRIPKGNFDAVA